MNLFRLMVNEFKFSFSYLKLMPIINIETKSKFKIVLIEKKKLFNECYFSEMNNAYVCINSRIVNIYFNC